MRSLRPKKRVAILVSILLVIASAGGYALWSKQVWGAYQPAYTQQHQNLKNDINQLVKAPTTTPEERKAVLSSFESMSRQTNVSDQKPCHIHPAVAWQAKVWHSLETAQADCVATMTSATKLGGPLQKVTAYIQDDNKLAVILAAAPQSGELADDTWETQVVSWQKLITDTEGLSTSTAFTPVKLLAVTRITAVKNAWQAVVAAHRVKDKAKYLAAQDDLAHALDGLNEITVTSEKELLPLTVELEKTASDVLDS